MTIERDVGALAASLDAFREELRHHIAREERWQRELGERLTDRLDDHGRRLRALERWRGWVLGALATLAAAWAALKVLILGRLP